MSTERESVARAIHGIYSATFDAALSAADAAIAALDAHRAEQVCMWDKWWSARVWSGDCGSTSIDGYPPSGDECPGCGKRVEVK